MAIMVTRSFVPPMEEYVREIQPLFENRWLTNNGSIHRQFQQLLETYLGVEHVSLFGSGHLALETAIQALGLRRPGGEVITTPFTFASTANAIVRNGLRPVFCDIRQEDCTLDPEKIEPLITEKTVAIIPVHVYGNPCDVDAIGAVARRHGLKVIYDAAHAFGVKWKGVGIGNFGDAAMFSFHATKVFHTVEGGCVTFRDASYLEALQELKNFGLHGGEDVCTAGGNAKLDEFRAAMGVCNLRHVDGCIARRALAARRYCERLEGVPGIYIPKSRPGTTANYAYFPVRFDPARFGRSRDEVCEALAREEIYARKYFYPAVNETSYYKNDSPQDTPVAHEVSAQILTLPLYPELAVEEADRICDVILG